MAFPLDNERLIDHIRTSLLYLDDNTGEGNDGGGDGSDDILRRVFYGGHHRDGKGHNGLLSSSPPITFNVARHLQNTMQKLASDYHNQVPRRMRTGGGRDGASSQFGTRSVGKKHHQKHGRKLSRIVEKQPQSPFQNTILTTREFSSSSLKEEHEIDEQPHKDEDATSEDNSDTPEFPQTPSTIVLHDKNSFDASDAVTENDRRPSISTVSDASSLSSMSTARRSTSLTYSSKIRRSTSRKKSILSDSEQGLPKTEKSKKKHMAKFRQYLGKKLGGASDSEDDSNSEDDDVSTNKDLEHIQEEEQDFSEGDDHSDALTIDSDFGVPVAKNGQVVRNVNPEEFERIKNRKAANKLPKSEDLFLDEDDTYLDEEDDLDEDEEGNDFDDDDEDEDEDEDEDDDEEDYEEDEGESYESEAFEDDLEASSFSDSEANSILDSSSLLLLSYNKSQSYIFGSNGHTAADYGQLTKKRKKKRGSFADTQSTKHTLSKGVLNSSVGKFHRTSSLNNIQQIKGFVIAKEKKQNLFKKIDIREADSNSAKQSNLSSMIKSRHKLSHTNPLSYYMFANLVDVPVGSKKVKLDIFLPPQTTPTLRELPINSNVAISDCIGYALLSLTLQTEEFKAVDDAGFYDPNNWRLELVDEDGENYGSFGILDRTRLLSSYNCPQQLALCRIQDGEEIARNNRSAPLPSEFKQSLDEFRTRSSASIVSNAMQEGSHEPQVDIQISMKGVPHDFTQQDAYRMTVPGDTTVGQLMQQFCVLSGMDPSRWKFREGSDSSGGEFSDVGESRNNPFLRGSSTRQSSTSKAYFSPVLNDTQLVSTLSSLTLEIVPNSAYSMILSASVQGNKNTNNNNNGNNYGTMNSMITPPANGLTSLITPSTLDERLLNMAIDGTNRSNATITTPPPPAPSKQPGSQQQQRMSSVSLARANKYLQDIMTGKLTMEMPPNINTVYFKWKVWRKKPTILNRIEKSLIIDGDYVHLAPSDDITFKDTNNNNNNYNNPFSNPSGGHSNNNNNNNNNNNHHHHHHHLYYYNYNNYYKELMLKTSSFHITQISKLKHYKNTKNPNHFKIVVAKPLEGGKETLVKKKYDLEASSSKECQEIVEKLRWVMQVYKLSTVS